jgi:orotate phosphoribosyltransferase
MTDVQKECIESMVRWGVLTFGDFVTKSGRRTPFFINTGAYRTGPQMSRLGRWYAETILDAFGPEFDVLFGPAYKGIPLCVATAISLARDFGKECAVCFNRKEAKDHGEGGVLIGRQPVDGDRVIIVEDVTTAGTSIRDTVPLLRAAAAIELRGLIVSVNRQEKGAGSLSALDQIHTDYGMPTTAIVSLDDIVSHLHNRRIDGAVALNDRTKAAIEAYRARYGA